MHKPSFRNNLIVLIVPIRDSSYVFPMTITSSIYIATITLSILKHAMGALVSFVNFCGLQAIILIAQQIKKKFMHKVFLEPSSGIFTM